MDRYVPAPELKPKKKPRGKPFKKGTVPAGAGRPKGAKTRIPQVVKEAIEIAFSAAGTLEPIYAPRMKRGKVVKKNGEIQYTSVVIGWKGTGKEGLVGWIKWLAVNEPRTAAGLLARIIPLQVTAEHKVEHTVTTRFANVDTSKMSLAELNAAFREAVGMTKPLAPKPKLVENRASMLIEGEVLTEGDKAA